MDRHFVLLTAVVSLQYCSSGLAAGEVSLTVYLATTGCVDEVKTMFPASIFLSTNIIIHHPTSQRTAPPTLSLSLSLEIQLQLPTNPAVTAAALIIWLAGFSFSL